MRQVTVTQLKNELSRYLRLVKQGEVIEVLERRVPIARLEGLGRARTQRDAHLSRLVRDGIVTRARRNASRRFLETPAVPCKADPVEVLLEERGDR